MSALFNLHKKNQTKSTTLLISFVLVLLGVSKSFATDGLKQIVSNTTSVTAGTSSGTANTTSSAGGSATYNSGVDWSRASGLPWKGINWSAGGTIPQSRIPKLSTAQMPSTMPSNWSSESSGMHCGYSRYLSGQKKYVFNYKCKGYTPYSSCPSGYGRVIQTTKVKWYPPNCVRNCSGEMENDSIAICVKT